MRAGFSYRSLRAALAMTLALGFAVLAGCGQKGPLTLPDSTRPVERLPSEPGGAATDQSGAEQPADDEQQERRENER